MQYSLEEIGTFLAKPDIHKGKYSDALLTDLINHLFPDNSEEVRGYLSVLPDHANHIRIQLACVHLSTVNGSGDIDKLVQNIDEASIDYRDLLMAYYS